MATPSKKARKAAKQARKRARKTSAAKKPTTPRKVAKKNPKKMTEEDRLLAAAEGSLAGVDDALGNEPSEGTAPPTEEELQEMLDSAVLGTYIDGQPSVCDVQLMDITGMCMALLKKMGNGLVSGAILTDIEDAPLEGAKFIVLWRYPDAAEDRAVELAQPERAAELERLAYKFLNTIPPSDLPRCSNEAIFALKDAMSTQVEPIPHDDEEKDDGPETGEEVEGND